MTMVSSMYQDVMMNSFIPICMKKYILRDIKENFLPTLTLKTHEKHYPPQS